MPSVASETNSPALNPPALPASRPLPAQDAAPSAPFASLLDDGTQSAAPPPAPSTPPADTAASQSAAPSTAAAPTSPDNTAKADATPKPDKTDKKAKAGKSTGDGKTAESNTGADGKEKAAAKTDAQAKSASSDEADAVTADAAAKAGKDKADAKTVAETEAKTEAKTDGSTDADKIAQAAAADNVLTPAKGKDKKTDAVKKSDAGKTKASDPGQVTTVNAVAVLIAPATTPVTAPAKPASQGGAIAATGTAKDKSAATALLQAVSGDAKATDAQAAPDSGKSPTDTGDAVKQTPADARTDTTAAVHHATPDAQPAPIAGAALAGAKAGADAAQPMAMSVLNQQTQSANAASAAPATPTQNVPAAPVPLAGIAVAIAGRALAGGNRFDIRLDPPDLGRIDVRLDVDKDGRVTSHLIADNKNTLNLLQQDASGLQRALQNAGLKTSDNGLQFSLRDQSSGTPQDNNATPASAPAVAEDDTLQPIALTPSSYAQLAALRGGLDIRV